VTWSSVTHLCTPPEGVDPARTMTPALTAGITDQGWTMHELTFPVQTRQDGTCALYGAVITVQKLPDTT
jgi:hypothetical protein